MKSLFDEVSFDCSKNVTKIYSTSFSMAVQMLSPTIQPDIHSIYGFVRFADEVVDSFHGYDKEKLLNSFEKDLQSALEEGVSLNPIFNSFQTTIKKHNIDIKLVDAFLHSMKMDLHKTQYNTKEEYEKYIYGSADVVGLMCLKVFVNGNEEEYTKLKKTAMKLGSAFQKVNFLRDLKDDVEILNRSYFPNVDLKNLTPESKKAIINEIESDFNDAYLGIKQLPNIAKFGVYTAYIYYKKLLEKLQNTPSSKILESRIRVNDFTKITLLAKSYLNYKLNILTK